MRQIHRRKCFFLMVSLAGASAVAPLRADEITATGGHPFYVTNRDANRDGVLGDWVHARDLRPDDRVRLADGGEAVLDATHRTHGDSGFTTYNLHVADFNTYFIGDQGLWVHNTGQSCSLTFDPDSPHNLISPGGRPQIAFYEAVTLSTNKLNAALDDLSIITKEINWELTHDLPPTWANFVQHRIYLHYKGLSQKSLKEYLAHARPPQDPGAAFITLQNNHNPKKFIKHLIREMKFQDRVLMKYEAAPTNPKLLHRVVPELSPNDFIYTDSHLGFDLTQYEHLDPLDSVMFTKEIFPYLGVVANQQMIFSPRPLQIGDIQSLHIYEQISYPPNAQFRYRRWPE